MCNEQELLQASCKESSLLLLKRRGKEWPTCQSQGPSGAPGNILLFNKIETTGKYGKINLTVVEKGTTWFLLKKCSFGGS